MPKIPLAHINEVVALTKRLTAIKLEAEALAGKFPIHSEVGDAITDATDMIDEAVEALESAKEEAEDINSDGEEEDEDDEEEEH